MLSSLYRSPCDRGSHGIRRCFEARSPISRLTLTVAPRAIAPPNEAKANASLIDAPPGQPSPVAMHLVMGASRQGKKMSNSIFNCELHHERGSSKADLTVLTDPSAFWRACVLARIALAAGNAYFPPRVKVG